MQRYIWAHCADALIFSSIPRSLELPRTSQILHHEDKAAIRKHVKQSPELHLYLCLFLEDKNYSDMRETCLRSPMFNHPVLWSQHPLCCICPYLQYLSSSRMSYKTYSIHLPLLWFWRWHRWTRVPMLYLTGINQPVSSYRHCAHTSVPRRPSPNPFPRLTLPRRAQQCNLWAAIREVSKKQKQSCCINEWRAASDDFLFFALLAFVGWPTLLN